MLPEALETLASTGGTALVMAMGSDIWEGIRARATHLFGLGETEVTKVAAERLDRSRAGLAALSGTDLERMRAEQEIIWRTRLGDLLEYNPSAEQELRGLIAEVQAQTLGASGPVVQRVTAHDHAQQAIQGHGVQHIHFGEAGSPDPHP